MLIYFIVMSSVALVCATTLVWQNRAYRFKSMQSAIDREQLVKITDERLGKMAEQLKATQVAIKKLAETVVMVASHNKVKIPGNFAEPT